MDVEARWNSWLRKSSRPSHKKQSSVHSAKRRSSVAPTSILTKVISQKNMLRWLTKRHRRRKGLPATAVESCPSGAEKEAGKQTVAAPAAGSKTGKLASGAGESNQLLSSPKEVTASGKRDPGNTAAANDLSESPMRNSDSSLKREGSWSQSPPKRSKAARPTSTPVTDGSRSEFDRGSQPKGSKQKLWAPDDPIRPPNQPLDKSNVASNHRLRAFSASQPKGQQQNQTQNQQPQPSSNCASSNAEDDTAKLIKQPETRPISQKQLITEVTGIYAGLVMVESKCKEVDAQNAQNDPANSLNNKEWQALINLHRALLHEHYDFFLASQHPSASPELMRVASKYTMPGRMWRHGIHTFLEFLSEYVVVEPLSIVA
ncbi:hypothetical protein V8F06_014463 [Rhypophila decipiens]